MPNTNNEGKPLGHVELTDEEFQELIWLIDDEPVDEEFLRGIRLKLVAKRRRLHKLVTKAEQRTGA